MSVVRHAICFGLVISLTSAGARTQPAAGDPLREYPTFDQSIVWMVRRGHTARDAARLLAEAPLSPRTFETLVQSGRVPDALAVLPRALAGPPELVEAMLGAVLAQMTSIDRSDARGYNAMLQREAESVRRRIPTFPREQAARIAYLLARFDNQLTRGGSRGWNDRARAFAQEYAGTTAALLADVDAITSDPSALSGQVDRLERVWREHPGTVVGAKALYQIASRLTQGAYNPLAPHGGDPTDRLLRVIDIVKELESGKYPLSTWTRDAPKLVSDLYYSEQVLPAIPPANVRRMLEAYYDFLRTHIDAPVADLQDSLEFIVTSRLSGLLSTQGNAVEGVEHTLDRLEKDVRDGAAVRSLRAHYYVRQWTSGPQDAREAMGVKARRALTALAREGRGVHSRRALATLASMTTFEGEAAEALPLYQQYLAAYPGSAWAWVASLRIGEGYQARGDWRRAAAAYEESVRRFGNGEPAALVIGSTFAARAWEALAEYGKAVDSYRRAIAGWDAGYGLEYGFAGARRRQNPIASTQDTIRREALVERLASLEATLTAAGGAVVERGRWQLGQRRLAEARATFEAFLRANPSSPLAADAQLLLHQAMFERGLELADADSPSRDEVAAMKALDEVALAEPFDMGVAFGRMARSALLARQGRASDARADVQQALERLVAHQAALRAQPAATPLDADIAAIRSVVFRPLGDLDMLRTQGWDSHAFPPALPPFVVVSADIAVKLPTSQTTKRLYQSFPGIERAVILTREELATIERVVMTIGGRGTQARSSVMQIFSNVGTDARSIGKLWGEVFPTQPGHWGGIVLQTYPMITRIEFLDEARTRANAFFTIGYSGATMVMEKQAGVWRALRVTGWWIT